MTDFKRQTYAARMPSHLVPSAPSLTRYVQPQPSRIHPLFTAAPSYDTLISYPADPILTLMYGPPFPFSRPEAGLCLRNDALFSRVFIVNTPPPAARPRSSSSSALPRWMKSRSAARGCTAIPSRRTRAHHADHEAHQDSRSLIRVRTAGRFQSRRAVDARRRNASHPHGEPLALRIARLYIKRSAHPVRPFPALSTRAGSALLPGSRSRLPVSGDPADTRALPSRIPPVVASSPSPPPRLLAHALNIHAHPAVIMRIRPISAQGPLTTLRCSLPRDRRHLWFAGWRAPHKQVKRAHAAAGGGAC